MGHKINPLIFRLGTSNNWQFNLKEKKNWVTSYLIYQLVSNQFFRYTVPHFNLIKKRNSRHSTGLVIMKGEKQLIANNFVKRSMLFSHVVLGSRNSKLEVNCFFYDYKLTISKKNKAKDFNRYNQLYSNVYLRWRPRQAFFDYELKKLPRKLYKWLRNMIPNLWVFNFSLITITNKSSIIKNLFNLTKICLRLFNKLDKFTNKQKIFYLNLFVNLLAGLLPILRQLELNQLANRFYLILLQVNLFNFDVKLNNSLFFVSLFRTRYFLFKAVSKSIGENLRSMLPNVSELNIKYSAIRERKMTASLLTNLILVKLGQHFRINSILYPLTNWLKRHKNVLGYRIMISGRLTRRERASHMIKSGKSMPLSSIAEKIDYNQDVKIMKFGMVGIKVYLYLKKKLRNSYYYFKFSVITSSGS